MPELPGWLTLTITVSGALGAAVTAAATFFLWRVTKILAAETTRMAQATSQPHVVATLAPNKWSMRHFDLHVDNTGNATAYAIEVEFDPPLQNGGPGNGLGTVPFGAISVLKPGHGMSTYLSEYDPLKDKSFRVRISWKRDASRPERETNIYTLSMADHAGISRLGDEPMVTIANQLKLMQEAWTPVARGSRRTQVDVFARADRLQEKRELVRQRRELRRQEQSSPRPQAGAADAERDA